MHLQMAPDDLKLSTNNIILDVVFNLFVPVRC